MKYFRVLVAIAFFSAFCSGDNRQPQQKKWQAYEPAIVELEGKLKVKEEFGPPNYGENPKTDQRVKVPILMLSEPINVERDPKSDLNWESVENVKEIQLVFRSGISHKQMLDQTVVVKGSLFHSFSGHHYTKILLSVAEIKKKSRQSAAGRPPIVLR